ncbi:uncharacterized protein BDW70DRAFT_106695 [Aspergillus foveolatus]|uniref:uncharacterized protein n=1 Tax=Aspergillus foveolatus TaxID=210207 RepID=UPI003CCE13E8
MNPLPGPLPMRVPSENPRKPIWTHSCIILGAKMHKICFVIEVKHGIFLLYSFTPVSCYRKGYARALLQPW